MDLDISSYIPQRLDHYGVVAGICHKLGISERIDVLLDGKDSRRKVSIGQAVTAMIINGLGYTNRTLYMMSDFFRGKPIQKLLQADIDASDLNDDVLGRALDSIHEYGTNKLFSELSFQIGKKFNLLSNCVHLDTTSLTLFGDYKSSSMEDNEASFQIVRGYSKAHREDLKQTVLSLCLCEPSGFPLGMESLSGNSSDKENFHSTIEKMSSFQKELDWPERLIWVADSALFHKEKLLSSDGFDWLTRVPNTIKETKVLRETDSKSSCWKSFNNKADISYFSVEVELEDTKMRWIVIHSEALRIKKLKTYDKNLLTKESKLKVIVKSLERGGFDCELDAKAALENLKKSHGLFILDGSILAKTKKKKSTYHLSIKIQKKESLIVKERLRLGRYILASNMIDKEKFTDEELIEEYKAQEGVERGFKFIKDNRFQVGEVFLKKVERIDALMMIMTLTLMVHNVGEYWLRESLKEKDLTLPNQLGKEIKTPTLRWVMQRLEGIDLPKFKINGSFQEVMSELDEIQARIISILPQEVRSLYNFP